MKIAWYVDDDGEMIHAISLMMQLLDYRTRPFLNAITAAKTLMGGEQPDLLILDINMPTVSGIDLLDFIRSRSQWDQIPIVMLSSETSDVQVDEALEIGADAFACKPVMLEELEEAIKSAIQNRRK